MEKMRKPFQGVLNIIRFNWHFYVIAFTLVSLLFLIANNLEKPLQLIVSFFGLIIVVSVFLSLLASFYIYDLSGLYDLKWIEQTNNENLIININAGFDETSHLIKDKFKDAELITLDFYNPDTHTEVSIKRARKAYPPSQETIQVETTDLKLADNLADKIFLILSVHEVRNEMERIRFFKELKRMLKPTGEIYITEHLRDLSNFLVYNIGFFHFFSKNSWLKTFNDAGFKLKKEIKLTPFISTFIIK